MYAIVEVGGMQWKVSKAVTLRVPKIDQEPGKSVELDKVLLVVDKQQVSIGTPWVDNALVKAKIVSHGKADKIQVFKKKRRKGYKVHKGHRQDYTELRIEGITLGKVEKKKTAEAKPQVKKTEPSPKAEPKKPATPKKTPEGKTAKPVKNEVKKTVQPKKKEAAPKVESKAKPKPKPKASGTKKEE